MTQGRHIEMLSALGPRQTMLLLGPKVRMPDERRDLVKTFGDLIF